MKICELTTYYKQYNDKWFSACKRVCLIAGTAKLPAPILVDTLYIQKQQDGSIVIHTYEGSMAATAKQQKAFVKAGLTFLRESGAPEKRQKNTAYHIELTDQAIVQRVKNICNPTDENGHRLASERRIAKALGAFIDTLEYNSDADIAFSAFIADLQANKYWPLKRSWDSYPANQAPLANWLTLWLKSEEGEPTFMATACQEIPVAQLLWLNNRYESAAEILNYMQSNAEQGKNIFLNPNTHPATLFSDQDQALLTAHPTCHAFITNHLQQQSRLENQILPQSFYDALHTYLNRLNAIGEQAKPWSFSEGQLSLCDHARMQFFTLVQSSCTNGQYAILPKKLIKVPFRNSNHQFGSATFADVAEGRGTYECIISQQIFLWAMLRLERPSVEVPANVVNHSQAIFYDLGPLASSSRVDVSSFATGSNTFGYPLRPNNSFHFSNILTRTPILEARPTAMSIVGARLAGMENFINPRFEARRERIGSFQDLLPNHLESQALSATSATGSNALNRNDFANQMVLRSAFSRGVLVDHGFFPNNVLRDILILEARQWGMGNLINPRLEAMSERIGFFQDLPPNHLISQTLSATRSLIGDTTTPSLGNDEAPMSRSRNGVN